MAKSLRVLIVDDSEDDAQLVLLELKRGGYDPDWERVDTPLAMKVALEKRKWDVIICDYVMPQFSGLAALSMVRLKEIDTPFILVSGTVNEDTLIEGMKLGAHDFITKGRIKRLVPAIEREIREAEVRREKRLAQNRVFKLNRLLKTISEVNQLIVRETDRGKVLSEACRILVEHGKFHSAWIGMADFATSEVRPLAAAGLDLDSLAGKVRCDDAPQGCGPCGTAVRTAKPVICNDYDTDETFADWAKEARERGYKSGVAFPILVNGTVFGVLGIYDTERQSFDREIINLLSELTADIGYALRNMTESAERKRAEAALRQSEEMYRSLFENMMNGFAYCRMLFKDGRPDDFIYIGVNRSFEALTGLKDVAGKKVSEVIPGIREQDPELFERYGRVSLGGAPEAFEIYVKSLKQWFSISVYCPQKEHFVAVFDVITARKRAEESLRESEERFRRAFDDAPIGMQLVALDGRFIRVNRVVCDILGYTEQELLAKDFQSITHPDDISMDVDNVQGLLAGRFDTFEMEKRYIHKRGHTVWVLLSVSLIRDAARNPLHFIGQIQDITEHKRSEAALKESEERFRSAFDDAPIGMALSMPDGRYLRVNRSLCGILGYSEKELLATTWQAITHPDDLGMNLLYMKQALAGDIHYFEVEKRYVHKGGRIVWALSGVSLVRDERGKPLHFVSQVRDITEQKRLAGEMVRLKQAVDNSGEIIFMTDAIGTITFVNPAFTRLYGYTSQEVIGKTTPRILKSGKHAQEEYELYWKAILSKQLVRREFVNKTKVGGLVTVECAVSPILDDRGAIAGFLAAQRDITDRKRAAEEKAELEAQLVLAQKMEAIGTLAGGVAHDFNNILTAIQGYTDLSLMKVPEDDPLRHNLTEVRKASERAANLTRQLLLFSQRQVVSLKPVDLNKIVTDLMKMLGRIVGEHYKLETNLQADLWTVSADSGQIDQVIMNLVVNARDAMPNGGEITIATENVGAEEEYYRQHPHARPGELVCLSVSDKGGGMDKETLSRIFEPFFTTKERGKGTGLGLAVVHGIVTKHDGWIDVESEPGKGSTFRVFLPVTSEEVTVTSRTKPKPRQSSGKGERILLLEDETTIRELAEKVLTENGYSVFSADCVKAGEALFEREGGAFDIVFSDVVLPDGSGMAFVEELIKRKPGIRVLLTSGYASGADGIAAAQTKGYPFLQKPYSLGDVLRMVRTLLNEK